MTQNAITSPAEYLSLVSSDDDYGFTLDAHVVAEAMNASPVEMAAKQVAYRDELEEERDFVFVSNDENEFEKHFTKAGIVKLGAIIATDQARAFADECAGFVPGW